MNRLQIWTRVPSMARWMIGILVVVGLVSVVLFEGYCWGWWGRNNVLLQAMLQCSCPPASEASRYAPLTVVASACDRPVLFAVSPSGRYTLVAHGSPQAHTERIDVVTGERHPISLAPILPAYHMDLALLNDTEVLVRRVGQMSEFDFYIINVLTQRITQISDIEAPTPAVAISPPPIPEAVWARIAHADVVLVGHSTGIYTIIARYLNDWGEQDGTIIYAGAERNHAFLVAELEQRRIAYEALPESLYERDIAREMFDTTQTLHADYRGIHNRATKEVLHPTGLPERISDSYWAASAWMWQDTGVLYTASPAHVLRYGGGFVFDFKFIAVPQPILLLRR